MPKSAKRTAATSKKSVGFSDEEKAAMREYVQQKKAEAAGEDPESTVLAKIAKMREPDRTKARRIHQIVKATVPSLTPRLWYGMPAYSKDDKVLCFFQDAAKFKSRYATLGFSDKANLDEGEMWPVVYALKELTAAEEAKISALVKRAAT